MPNNNFSAISWGEQMLNWIFIVLAHWNNSVYATPFWHTILIPRQSLLLLLKGASLAKKQQQISILWSLVWPYPTLEGVNHYTNDAVLFWLKICSFLSGSKSVLFFQLFISVWLLEIQTLKGCCLGSINRFKPATFFCLSQDRM